MNTVPIRAVARAWVEVDLDALRRNYRALANRLPPGTGVLPMVKADGYGSGAVRVMRALAPLGPWGMGVATAEEGRELRAAGWGGRVLVFMPCPPEDAEAIVALGLEPAVSGPEALAAYGDAAARSSAGTAAQAAGPAGSRPSLPVHLEVDTGMGRFGVSPGELRVRAPEIGVLLERYPLELASVFTHFHSAATDERATRLQWRRYRDALEALREANVRIGFTHVASSAAALRYPESVADVVRPGIHLYGGGSGPPVPEPVIAVRARVLDVREVPAGTTVSYGARYTTSGPARLATLGIGYGDGLRRSLSGRWCARIGRARAPIRGEVCMDCTVVEVPGSDAVRPGDVATLLEGGAEAENGLEAMATACGTIDYEILTGWSRRLPRVERGGSG